MNNSKSKSTFQATIRYRVPFFVFVLAIFILLFSYILIISFSQRAIDPNYASDQYFEAYKNKDIARLAEAIYPRDSQEYRAFISDSNYFAKNSSFKNIVSYKYVYLKKNGDTADCDMYAVIDDGNGQTREQSIKIYFVKRAGQWYLTSDFYEYTTKPIDNNNNNNNNGTPSAPDNPNQNNPLRLSDTSVTTYVVQAGDYVDYLTFNECQSLVSITFPSTYIRIDQGWFRNCRNLCIINVNSNNPYFTSVDGIVYSKEMTKIVAYPSAKLQFEGQENGKYVMPDTVVSAVDSVFEQSSGLFEIVFSENFAVIPRLAFGYSKIKNVTFGAGITKIGQFAFSECNQLTTISIPSSMKIIDYGAFNNCQSLYEINFQDNSSLKTIGYSAFDGCKMLQISALPDTVEAIGNWAFQDTQANFTALPANLKHIGMYAFRRCYMLKDVFVPGNIEYIGRGAFMADFQLELRFAAPSPNEKWDAMWDAGIQNEPVWSAEATN